MKAKKATKLYAFTRQQLEKAFKRWNDSSEKTSDGKRFVDNTVGTPAGLASTLIRCLAQ